MNPQRIAPIDPPYAPENQKLFDLAMPEGMEPGVELEWKCHGATFRRDSQDRRRK